jgi:hypothetical protein
MRVERVIWDYEDGKYSIKYLADGKYLVCTDDRTCFLVYNIDNINEIINAVEEYAKAELF